MWGEWCLKHDCREISVEVTGVSCKNPLTNLYQQVLFDENRCTMPFLTASWYAKDITSLVVRPYIRLSISTKKVANSCSCSSVNTLVVLPRLFNWSVVSLLFLLQRRFKVINGTSHLNNYVHFL